MVRHEPKLEPKAVRYGSPAGVRLETRRKFERLIPARRTPDCASGRQTSGLIGAMSSLNVTGALLQAALRASATSAPKRFVPVFPPRSGVRETGSARTVSIAASIA